MREHGDPDPQHDAAATPEGRDSEAPTVANTVAAAIGSTTVGTLWTLNHQTEGVVSLNVGPHPHGYELRVILNNRFLRSRVHREFSGVLADATDTRERFEELGFSEVPARFVH